MLYASRPHERSPRQYTLGGLILAACGLAAGALVMYQVMIPMMEGVPVRASAEWIAAEATLCGCLSGAGFVLMVLGANSLPLIDDFPDDASSDEWKSVREQDFETAPARRLDSSSELPTSSLK